MAQAQGNALGALGKLTELRQRIFFVIGALVVFRLGSFIPVPGVNPEAMTRLIQGGGGLLNMSIRPLPLTRLVIASGLTPGTGMNEPSRNTTSAPITKKMRCRSSVSLPSLPSALPLAAAT